MISKCVTTRRLTEATEEAAKAACDAAMTVLPGGVLLHCASERREDVAFVSWTEIMGASENPLLARVREFDAAATADPDSLAPAS